MPKIKHLRWWICILLFVATSLSFMDRQVLSVVAPVITKEFGMSNTVYSQVIFGFLLSYSIMFFLGGRVIDWLGTRLGMALSVGFWSLASAIHGLVQNPLQLGIVRFLLGVGEGGCFPGATKGITEWFPQKERGEAIGIAIGGSAFGAVIAPPMTVWIVSLFGWRGAFFATGIIGTLWVLIWWFTFKRPEKSTLIIPEELEYIKQGHENVSPSISHDNERNALTPLRILLRVRQVWGLTIIRFLLDPVFYFYMFWIPQYLNQERSISLQRIGELTWIPFFVLGVANIAGGWISDHLVKSGMPVNRARKLIMTGAALLTPFSVIAAFASSAETAIALMSLLMFAHGFWITNYVTIISEMFDSNSVSTVMGLAGAGGGIGGMIATLATGPVVDHFSFLPVWIASGCMYPLGLVILIVMVGTIRRIDAEGR